MMREILEKLTLLTEAPVKPGERKDISFKLKKLDKVNSELQEYKQSLYHMGATKLPPALKQEMDALQEKLNVEIDKVQKAYDAAYQKSLVNDRPVKMNNLFKALSKHCKEIIKVYKELNKNTFTAQRFVYRGIRSNDDALYGKPFEARKPKDSSSELHDMVNNAINSLGFEANRENAMFVTGDRSQASGYGYSLYVMFPVDGFKFTWSQTVKDLVLDSGKKQQMMDSDIIDEIRSIVTAAKEKNPEIPVMYPSDLFSNGYSYDSDFERVSDLIDKGLIPDTAQELLDNILTYESTQKHFKFTDQDLFKAILSNKEIYIKAPYYAVNVTHMDELIRFLQQEDVDSVKLPESFGEMPDTYDKGDIVKIVDGDYKDKIGTVTYIYSDSLEVYLNEKSGDVTVPTSNVELYKLPDGSIPLFEKGEKIIVTDPGSKQYGAVGTIYTVYPNGKLEYTTDSGGYHTGYKHQVKEYTPELEQEILKDLETRPPELNVGDIVIVSDPDSEYYKERGKVNYIYSTGKVEVFLTKKDTYIDFQPENIVLLKNAPDELKASGEPGVFQIGDSVQITDGDYKNFYATVVYLYGSSDKAEVELTGMDKKVDVWLTDLAHVGKSAEPTFKAGDIVDINGGHYTGKKAEIKYVSPKDPSSVDLTLLDTGSLITLPVSLLSPAKEEEKYVKGDKVTVINGEYKGKTGTVDYVYNSYPEVSIDFEDGTSKDINVSDVKKITPDEPASAPPSETSDGQIKVGDKVEVINQLSSYANQVGSVVEVGKSPDGKEWVKIVANEFPSGIKTFASWVKKVSGADTTPEFKPNDKFKIKNKSYSVDGVIATILDGPDKDGDYKSVTVDGKIVFTAPDQMEKIESEPEYKFAFKVGDTVKVKSGGNILYNEGKTGVVDEIYKDYGTVSVKFPEGNTVTYLDTELEKVEQPKTADAHTLNIGDWVKVTAKDSDRAGETGKLKSGPDKDGDYVVEFFENGEVSDWEYLTPSQFEKVSTTEPSVYDFKLGDVIQITDQSNSNYGKLGKINYIYPSGALGYETDEGQGGIVQASQIKKYSMSSKIDDLKWEPEPEVQAPLKVGDTVKNIKSDHPHYGQTATVDKIYPSGNVSLTYADGVNAIDPKDWLEKVDAPKSAPKFEVGDSVEVTSQFPSLIGMKGKITQTNPNFDFVSVQLDGNNAASSFPASALKKVD